MVLSLNDIFATGGMKVYHGKHGTAYTWVPKNLAVSIVVVFCSLFIVVGVGCLLYVANNKIVTDADRISQTGAFGKVSLRARWDEVITVSEDTSDDCPSTKVITARGTLEFQNDLP